MEIWLRGLRQRFAKPSIMLKWSVGSNPTISANGTVAEWSKAAVCKTVKPSVQIRPVPPLLKWKHVVKMILLFLYNKLIEISC